MSVHGLRKLHNIYMGYQPNDSVKESIVKNGWYSVSIKNKSDHVCVNIISNYESCNRLILSRDVYPPCKILLLFGCSFFKRIDKVKRKLEKVCHNHNSKIEFTKQISDVFNADI